MVICQASLIWTADKCTIICDVKRRIVDVTWGKLLDLNGLRDAGLETERTEEKLTR